MSDLSSRKATEHPGALLRDRVLPALKVSVSQAARELQVTRQTLHRLMAGEAALTPDMAARLERFCGIRSQFWLELQHDCELKRVATLRGALYERIPMHALPEAFLKELGALDD